MIDSLPIVLTGADSFVPGTQAFLAAVILFGTIAVVSRPVDWVAAIQLDQLALGIAYVFGLVGYFVTGDLALVFAPPTMTLCWLFVGQQFGSPRGIGRQFRGGGSGDRSGRSESTMQSQGGESDTGLTADQLNTDPPGHDFSDVGGMDDLKETLADRVIDPLTDRAVYDRYGIGAVNGVLFYGPPGCGKTFVASAVAAETGYNYIEVSPAEITSKYIGEAADNIATLFEAARKNEPCLVFIDEIDAIASDRSGRMASSEQQMVNQLLTELETQQEADIVVFAATNYLEDVDDAILRSGRFDERIEIPPPDREARLAMLRLELADAPCSEDIVLEAIAEATAGYASSDVTLVADVAIRHAIGEESPVAQSHLLQAVEEVDTSIPDWLDRYEDRFEEDLGRSSTTEPVAFADLPGRDDLTAVLERLVLQPVSHPNSYERHGVPSVDGVLLYGPPDAGKTTLARSIAVELDRPVFELSPDRFRLESVDDPADRAAAIIEDARAGAPSVLLLDDLDRLAPGSGGSRSIQRLAVRLETLLPTLADDVLVVGTARAVDQVDSDVLHAGAFDERIEVPPPDGPTRLAILQAELPDGFLAADVDFDAVADATAGFSVRDIRHLAGRVARQTLRQEQQLTTERLVAAAGESTATLEDWDRQSIGEFHPDMIPGARR